ncbi:MAG: hypothetical protein H3C48_10920 [Chitinophagaceae bacterium]|nr:hypothetical protein [Chitinophagaceae bacterium]
MLKQNEKIKLFKQEKLHYFFTALLSRSHLGQKDRNIVPGGFAIEENIIRLLLEKIPRGSLIVELGSGFSTNILLKYYKVISVEHNLFYAIQRSPIHICIHAPIQSGWYQPEAVSTALQNNPDAILVDGPPAAELRRNILENLPLFASIRCPIIFDDLDREVDHATALDFCIRLGYKLTLLKGEKKKIGWCEKILTTD